MCVCMENKNEIRACNDVDDEYTVQYNITDIRGAGHIYEAEKYMLSKYRKHIAMALERSIRWRFLQKGVFPKSIYGRNGGRRCAGGVLVGFRLRVVGCCSHVKRTRMNKLADWQG